MEPAQPWPITPMKGVIGALPSGPAWVFEPKWDGHRALVRTGGQVEVLSSTGRDRTGSWPWLHEALGSLATRAAVIDGEVIALSVDGRHEFGLVGDPAAPHALVVFDLLGLDGEVLLTRSWHERRALLEAAITPGPQLIVTPVTVDGVSLFEVTRASGFEGVIAKRADSTYRPGTRSPAWVKVKHRWEQEFVVGGYLPGTGARSVLGSLLLGVYDDRGVLRFAGAAGSGLSDTSAAVWASLLEPGRLADCPFDPTPAGLGARAVWVAPIGVAQVRFAGWTHHGRLRHPVVLGRREDVDPSSIVREPRPS